MKHNYLLSLTLALLFAAILTGCEKKEQPITLPAKGNALPGRITMGEDYETQVFYDFESNSVVKTSDVSSWDLSFQASKDGCHVWMNGAKGMLIANTHLTSFTGFKDVPAGVTTNAFLFDDPSGNVDSTAVGNWRNSVNSSKNEIYIVKMSDTVMYKFRLLAVTDTNYTMEWCNIKSTDPQTVVLKKDDAYNHIYFSFTNGIVTPDPAKNLWDVVFTRYRYIYRDLNNFPYSVNGVLLNPYNTAVAADSVNGFSTITTTTGASLITTTAQDAIGFDWKRYNFSTARYEVNTAKTYVLHTRNGQLIKLHFLDFYSSTGVKGSPSFESERLQ